MADTNNHGVNQAREQEQVRFLQQLIQIDSSNPPGKEGAASQFLAARLQAAGLEVRVLPVAGDRCNVEARLCGGRRNVEWAAEPVTVAEAAGLGELPAVKELQFQTNSTPRTLLFCGHMDTVTPGDPAAWTYPPHAAVMVNNRLYGRGASDMKSGLAAMILAMEELAADRGELHGDLLLLITVGEEVDCIGARHYMEHSGIAGVDALVIGEPTNSRIAVGHKGALWLEIATQGVTAHASMPERGVNAIDHMLELLATIRAAEAELVQVHPVLGRSTLTLTKLTGGIQTNMIPDRCTAELDIRTVPPQKHEELLDRLTRMLQETSERLPDFPFELNLLLDRAPIWTEPNNELIRLAQNLKQRLEIEHSPQPFCGVSYFTDGSILNPDNRIPTLLYGPGDDQMAHKPDEYVDLEQYRQAIIFYKQFAQEYLSADNSRSARPG